MTTNTGPAAHRCRPLLVPVLVLVLVLLLLSDGPA
jgi:hypothetical protein